MRREHVSEEQLAATVVAWLEELGADVYQEVEVSGGVADIVARVCAEIWIVEAKTSLSLALLMQAMERRRLAHRIFVAAPYTRRANHEVFDALGIGVLEVRPGSGSAYDMPSVREVVSARRWNRKPVALAGKLKPEHKTHAKAGAVGAGGRWTPFRDTCEQLARIVRDEPGIALKDAVAKIRHHYRTPSSARGSLLTWVRSGKVPGVRLEHRDGTRLVPAESA